MAIIGCLGDIPFEVSADVVRTLDNMTWSGKAQYATHNRHAGNALTEFTGLDPDEISFTLTFSAYLGVNPQAELVKLWNYERKGTPVPLVIGDKPYGKYKWTIISHSTKLNTYDPAGTLATADVSVSLLEYLKE